MCCEDKLKPPGDPKTAAWDCTEGSEVACLAYTEERIDRKEALGVKFWGVGGREVHAPMASFWFGGVVGRRVRREVAGSMGCL
jgi:hypothetical protein